jgi:hypothetical protein
MDDTARGVGGKLGEYTYGDRNDKSTADVVRDIISNVQEMVRSEVRLAKAEVREEANRTIAGAKKLAIGAVACVFSLAFFLWAATYGLSAWMPVGCAAFTVSLVLGIVGAMMLSKAKNEVRVPTPHKTIENVKENVEWMKNQTRS